MPEKETKRDTTEETDISTDVEPMGETPKVFESIKRDERRLINILEVNTLRNATDKTDYGLLSDTDKTDLTDGGETSLHSHAFVAHDLDDHGDPGSSIDMANQHFFGLQDTKGFGFGDDVSVRKDYVDKYQFNAGEQIVASSDALKNVNNTSYSLLKEVITHMGGTIKIRFLLQWGSAAGAYVRAQIYKNGTPIAGTERERTTGNATYTLDIPDWEPGDLVQIYGRTEQSIGGNIAHVRNYRLYIESFSGATVVLD